MPPNSEFIKSVQDKVAEVAQGGIFMEKLNDHPEGISFAFFSGGYLGLTEDNHNLVPVIKDSLARRSGWRDHFTDGDIHAAVLEMIVEHVNGNPGFVETRLHDMHEQVANAETVEIVFPTYNIALEPGEHVTLGRLTFVQLHESLQSRLESAIHAGDEDRALIGLEHLKAFPDVAVIYSGQGSTARVFENAREYLAVNQDLLNLVYGRIDRTSWIGMPGSRTLVEALTLHGTPEQATSMRIRAPQEKLMLSMEFLKETLVPLTLELSDRNTPLNTLEQAFVNAMRWYANAGDQRDAKTAFLGYANALETMFTPDQNDQKGITHSIAEAMAFIAGVDPASRQTCFEQVKYLYRQRSDIVHGKSVKVSGEDLEAIRTLTFHALRFIAGQLSTWTVRKDIDAYVTAMRWAGDARPNPSEPHQDAQADAAGLRSALADRDVEISMVVVSPSQLSFTSLLAFMSEHEAADPLEMLADLGAARPGLIEDESWDEQVLLTELRTLEGPGVLGLIQAPGARRWVFMASEEDVQRAALALTGLPSLEDERGADLGEYQSLQDTMTAAHRARLAQADRPAGFTAAVCWADLLSAGDDEADDDRGQAPLTAVDAHVHWFAQQELHALGRLSAGTQTPVWPDVLQGAPLLAKALWEDLEVEVAAVLAGRDSQFPTPAQAEIRAAAQFLDEDALITCLEADLATVEEAGP